MSHAVVDDTEWRAARQALLIEEKALQRRRDELAAKRRQLPWRVVAKDYRFTGEEGERTLAELFGDSSQLAIYHFMFHPEWEEGCKSCSFWADSYDRSVTHLAARDARLIAVSRAPLDKLTAYRERLGWTFPWYSSYESDFNFDFEVSFTPKQLATKDGSYNYRDGAVFAEEMPGLSTFIKTPDGTVHHTYSTYSRGLDPFNTTYQLLDVMPKGRDEDALEFSMSWLRRNDEYRDRSTAVAGSS